MKKVLTLLTSFSLIATSSVLVVSCKTNGVKGKVEESKDGANLKEQNNNKTPEDMNKISQSDEGQSERENRTNPTLSNKTKDNIFSSAEDEKYFIYGYNKWLEDGKKGNAEHVINPDNPNEILLLGYTKETKGRKEVYKLKQIPTNVNKVPKWLPQKVTSLESAFKNNENEKINRIEFWDTSKITNMYQTFFGASRFNQDISKWKTSNVDDFSYMFYGASAFKIDLKDWNISKGPFPVQFAKNSGFEKQKDLWPRFKNNDRY
ncbi:BspA family leucine-rich repeat surface protein [Mycoplasma mycoides]|uniref:BspA family leucine-rich repeat surface protein n=1 Tax=Mycoplasma mycoides TaxID=2102 RepID=UPI00223F3158|nr:BspA family leucine-rich repeat surface protein [Mycoplasma mycoides]QVJ95677.1 BspA family leucine-rich repeat surface protein [Mycoplasma mycoides subsp. capri]